MYDKEAYSKRSGLTTDPLMTSGNEHRVLRGGSWNGYPRNARSASHSGNSPDRRDFNFGFRVVCASGVRTR